MPVKPTSQRLSEKTYNDRVECSTDTLHVQEQNATSNISSGIIVSQSQELQAAVTVNSDQISHLSISTCLPADSEPLTQT